MKGLKAAGFTEAQAEAVARVVRDAQDIRLSGERTTTDLRLAVAEMKWGLQLALAETKADVQRDLWQTRAQIVKWIVVSTAFQTVVGVGALLALARSMGRG